MYSIGDKVEVGVKMICQGIFVDSKVMTITDILTYSNPWNGIFYKYVMNNDKHILYSENRILGKVE